MPYDIALADRVRPILKRWAGLEEKNMFGGVGFLLRGNLCVAVWREFLIVRLGTEAGGRALAEPFVRPFDVTGRPMKGWAMIEPEGLELPESLERWIQAAAEFASELPPKTKSR